jgi:hypothetical protein
VVRCNHLKTGRSAIHSIRLLYKGKRHFFAGIKIQAVKIFIFLVMTHPVRIKSHPVVLLTSFGSGKYYICHLIGKVRWEFSGIYRIQK